MSDSPDIVDTWSEPGPEILFNMWLLQQSLTPLIESAINSTGLSADEYGFYLLLARIDEATPRDIARLTGMRANTTSAALSRLERRGHLIRTPNEHDRRSVLVRLSSEGLKVVEEAVIANRSLNDRISTALEGTGIPEAIFEFERIVRMVANMPAWPEPAQQPRPS